MKVSRILVAVIVFSMGYLLGGLMQPKPVIAQGEQQCKQNWILQPIKEAAHFDGYLYNPTTGEVFMLETRHKIKIEESK